MNHDVAKAILGGSMGASALTTIGLGLFSAFQANGASPDSWMAFVAFFALSAIVTALVACTIGLGWHALASEHNWRSALAYVIPATLTGGIVPLSFYFSSLGRGPVGETVWLGLTVYGASQGGLTGLIAWLIRRPDRDVANPATPAP
jgi:hypothetical protein